MLSSISTKDIDKIKLEDIKDNIILININQLYRENMEPFELYEATRGHWVVTLDNAKKAKYAFSVFKGEVLEVYEIVEWFPALSTLMQREINIEPGTEEKRYEFVGKLAPDEIRDKYKYKSVAHFYEQGMRNPIRYILQE